MIEAPVGQDRHLYEFVVPMVPPAWNDGHRVAEYSATVAAESPTAAAYSILEHWVLTHFLIDGHLSLLDEHISIATPEDVTTMAQARAEPQQKRTPTGYGHLRHRAIQ